MPHAFRVVGIMTARRSEPRAGNRYQAILRDIRMGSAKLGLSPTETKTSPRPPSVPPMIRQGPGQYRVGDYKIVRETPRIWRVWWLPEDQEGKVRAGLPADGFPTLREARACAENEIKNDLGTPSTEG